MEQQRQRTATQREHGNGIVMNRAAKRWNGEEMTSLGKALSWIAMERRRKRGQGGAWHGDTMQRNGMDKIRVVVEMKRGELQ